MRTDDEQVRCLRTQRNFAAAAAILFVIISLGAVLPRFLKSQRELKTANQEVVDLQSYIVVTQQRTRETETEILQTQKEIRALIRRSQ